jgi:hypothetical protein
MFHGYCEKWPDQYFVVADSGNQHQKSFIARGREMFKPVLNGSENKIELHDLAAGIETD